MTSQYLDDDEKELPGELEEICGCTGNQGHDNTLDGPQCGIECDGRYCAAQGRGIPCPYVVAQEISDLLSRIRVLLRNWPAQGCDEDNGLLLGTDEQANISLVGEEPND